MDRVTYPSLEHVAIDASVFPIDVLEGAESGLVLFAAAFLGRNDAIHYAEAGVPDVTLVDIDGERLEEMRALYRSPSWEWLERDAFAFAREAREAGRVWDVVSVDTFTGEALERSVGDLEAWTSIARRAVVVTSRRTSAYVIPDGWRSRRVKRSVLVEWLVLERLEE